jgi:hypothetical protein
MEEKDIKTTADEMMAKDGNVKGDVFHTHENYICYREGEEGIRKVEEKMKEIGYPMEFKEMKTGEWYKEGLSVLVILVAKEVFNWTEEDIYDMGNSAPKCSFIIKMFIKQFVSVKDIFEKAGQYWEKHYDFGSLEKVEFNEEEKYIIIRIKDYRLHEVACGPYLRGYITRIAQLSLKSEKIETEHTKDVFKGDDYNEYKIKWV